LFQIAFLVSLVKLWRRRLGFKVFGLFTALAQKQRGERAVMNRTPEDS
jgi:hypothetical protein